MRHPSRCYRCGGTVIPSWEEPTCLQCGRGLTPPRAPDLEPEHVGRMEPRRIVRCEECGTPVRAYGMGAHRKMHGREAQRVLWRAG